MPEVGRVDISALFGPPGPARDRCDKDLWEGLRDTGSVVITGYPGADEVDLRARTGLAVGGPGRGGAGTSSLALWDVGIPAPCGEV